MPHATEGIPDVFVAHCPERVLPGKIMIEMITNDRVVGGVSPRCAAKAASIYRVFSKGKILLTDAAENPNGAQALFIVDSAELGETEGFDRCFIIFDGRDEAAVAEARTRWKTLRERGANLAYWKQSSEGRWEKAA